MEGKAGVKSLERDRVNVLRNGGEVLWEELQEQSGDWLCCRGGLSVRPYAVALYACGPAVVGLLNAEGWANYSFKETCTSPQFKLFKDCIHARCLDSGVYSWCP